MSISFASSAKKYNLILSEHISIRSFVKIINRRGPNIDPCGMPLKTSAQHENIPASAEQRW